MTVWAGNGGGIYYAGRGGNSRRTAGMGLVTFNGEASGDVLTAAAPGADKLIAGAGAKTLTGGTSTGSMTLQAGSGADTLIAAWVRRRSLWAPATAASPWAGRVD